jgi:hypothetical protein
MSLAKEMWTTLSKVDVRKHIEQRQGLNYLSWAWAWGALMEHYPAATYTFTDRTFQDGTMEVAVDLVITEGEESITRHMWLPVMQKVKKVGMVGIVNPNSFQINTTKMRCLTKAIGMCGLGYHIYAGEDLIMDEIAPVLEVKKDDYITQMSDSLLKSRNALTKSVHDNDPSTCREVWDELSADEHEVVWSHLDSKMRSSIKKLLKAEAA